MKTQQNKQGGEMSHEWLRERANQSDTREGRISSFLFELPGDH